MPTASADRPWLYGPLRDLLLGCGLAYVGVFALLATAGPGLRAWIPAILLPVLTLVLGAPHYGATLLRVYAQRDDRRAYALLAVHVTALLGVLLVVGAHVTWVGSLLLTAYVTWSPWHYSGQNYGIAVMFLRRGGATLDPATRHCLYLSFLLSFALTVLAIHGEATGAIYAPASAYASTEGGGADGMRILSLGIPTSIAAPLFLATLAAYLLTTGVAAGRLLRRASGRTLVPVATLVVVQALWFSVPVAARHFRWAQDVEALAGDHYAFYFFWAALGHVVQYLWVTSAYARRTAGFGSLGSYLGRCLFAGVAIFTVPAVLLAPDLLGRTPFNLGLGALVVAVVNLHHFVLDGAIWKLRDGRIARILVRRETGGIRPEPIAPRRGLSPRTLLAAVGVAALAVNVGATWEVGMGLGRAAERGDVERVRTAIRRLAWLGRESPVHHLQLAQLLIAEREPHRAVEAIERAVAAHPSASTWLVYGRALEEAGRHPEALEAYREVLARDAGRADVHYKVGTLWLRQGRADRARAAFARAAEIAPDEPRYREAERKLAEGS